MTERIAEHHFTVGPLTGKVSYCRHCGALIEQRILDTGGHGFTTWADPYQSPKTWRDDNNHPEYRADHPCNCAEEHGLNPCMTPIYAPCRCPITEHDHEPMDYLSERVYETGLR